MPPSPTAAPFIQLRFAARVFFHLFSSFCGQFTWKLNFLSLDEGGRIMHAGDGVKYPARRQKKGKKGPQSVAVSVVQTSMQMLHGCFRRAFKRRLCLACAPESHAKHLSWLDWARFCTRVSQDQTIAVNLQVDERAVLSTKIFFVQYVLQHRSGVKHRWRRPFLHEYLKSQHKVQVAC